MNVAVLFSGGKDSTFALWWAYQQGWEICCLITLCSRNPESYMFHTPNISLAKVQAECLGLPLVFVSTSGRKEEELADLKDAVGQAQARYGIDAVVTGAVASDYQEERVNRVCHELGVRMFSPLWHKNQEQLVQEMIGSGFVFKIVSVAAMGLGEGFLGATYDAALLEKLREVKERYGIHLAGEGGEFETMVVDCPLFNQRVVIDEAETCMVGVWDGVWFIRKVHTEPKSISASIPTLSKPMVSSSASQ